MTHEVSKPWYAAATREQWKTLFAAQLGWMLDAMDVMLYAFAITAIRSEFSLSSASAGALAAVTLVASSFGGALFGILADRIGRAKALVYSILTYSVFTALTATSGTLWELILWRTLVGLGLGGEWSAGSVLVAETWPPEHRAKAVGLMQSGWAIGYMFAAVLAAAILPAYGWRVLFFIGIAPALLTVWIRRSVPEPHIWKSQPTGSFSASFRELFKPPHVNNTLIASFLAAVVLFAYWGLFTWLPTFLSTPVERGGAGMSIVKSSSWIIPVQIGAFAGYTAFGFLADRFGRRPVFIAFLIGAGILVPIYGQAAGNEPLLLILGPLIGLFGHGYFSVFGVMLAELFPTRLRGLAQGLTFNGGRALSALAPITVGALADQFGIGTALGVTSAFFIAGAGLMTRLPETMGKQLE